MLLETEKLDVGYGRKIVISQVQIKAMRGQVICLLGPNGAGKSTILRTLSGLLAPVNGVVRIEGTDIAQIKKKQLAQTLSLVLTEPITPALTTVSALVAMGRTPYTDFLGRLTEEDHAIIREALETVGAAHLKDRLYSELSDGEKQKVMIARALVQQPQLIILDEPTSHLDIKHKVEVIRVLQRLANERGITCILSLHDIDLALKGCQTVLLVHGGRIVAQGAPEDVVGSGMIQRLYGIEEAGYDELLGLVELRGGTEKDVFVVGGGGTGIRLFRALARKGYGITAGVLHQNDQDFAIARLICREVIGEEPFEPIREPAAAKARVRMRESRCVVDSGFAVGAGNRENMRLLCEAAEAGQPVFSLRTEEEGHRYYGDVAGRVQYVASIGELLERIAARRQYKNTISI